MGEWVQIEGPDGAFKAYVARPSAAPKVGVVVLQEIFGVNKVVRGKADWLAREGFLAVAPDLFWRIEPGVDITDQSEAEWAKAMDLMDKYVKLNVGTKDIEAAITATRKMGVSKVGAVGYCLGGLLAYLTACRTDCDASVGYYGVNIPAFLGEAGKIKKPLMLHIAGKDGFVKKDAQDAMHAALDPNPLVTLHDYPERDHAFTREGGKNYHAGDAKIADGRTVGFFKQHLA
jgi:carboxymethylenebutenolidase